MTPDTEDTPSTAQAERDPKMGTRAGNSPECVKFHLRTAVYANQGLSLTRNGAQVMPGSSTIDVRVES